MNTNIEILEVTSIPEYIDQISKISTAFKNIWYRGIANFDQHKLIPSIQRATYKSKQEKIFIKNFRNKSLPYFDNYQSNNYYHWLFLMQHHGVPTRLLDWSESAIVALAFSLFSREINDLPNDAAIWCLEPKILNKKVKVQLEDDDLIPDIIEHQQASATYTNENAKLDYPLAIVGPINSPRIQIQKGVFTVFPFNELVLEDLPDSHEYLKCIRIKKDNINDILLSLKMLGITITSLYPDLDHLAAEIKEIR